MKLTIGEKIKTRREQLGISATALAERVGVARMTLYRYEQDPGAAQNMTLETLAKLAKELHVPAAYLIGQVTAKTYDLVGLASRLNDTNQNYLRNHIRRMIESQLATETMPAELRANNHMATVDVWGAVSAGTGETMQEEHAEPVQVPKPVPEHDYALRVNGNSMEPLLSDQQIIFVRRPDYNDNPVYSGQIVIASVNGEAYVKKLVKDADGIKLVSLNPKYHDIIISDWDDFAVKGTVVL